VRVRRTLWSLMLSEPDAPSDVVVDLLRDPDQLVHHGIMLKDGDRCTVVRLDACARPLVLKRYNARGLAHTAIHAFMRSRARWAWLNARILLREGFLTPRPLVMLEERAVALRRRSFLLMEHVNGRSLDEMVRAADTDRRQLDTLATAFAELWRRLGEARITCGDMKANNFLIAPDGRWWMIDLDGMRRHRLGLMWRRERRRDADSFLRNWRDMPQAMAAFAPQLEPSR
jgi:Lipopolysaccharide kinase (Kdo/WaaP) family